MKAPRISGFRFAVPVLLTGLLSGGLTAQTPAPAARPARIRTVPAVRDISASSPFALDGHGPAFRIVPAADMSAQDRELVARSQATLRSAAALQNIDFAGGDWQHVQLACPSFPNHLLLRFERNNGSHDLSIFSAAISGDRSGGVRVLPILRRSYSLFSPAPRNARTIAIFNRLLREEKTAAKPDWASLAACYAAFSDQEPELGSATPAWSIAPQPTLRLEEDGHASIEIVTLGSVAHRWTLKFAPSGRLLSATSVLEQLPRVHAIPAMKQTTPRAAPGAQNDRE